MSSVVVVDVVEVEPNVHSESPGIQNGSTLAAPPLAVPPPIVVSEPCVQKRMTPRLFLLAVELILFQIMVMFVEMMVVPALSSIQKQYQDQSEWVAWVLSSYNIIGAIWTSVAGSLADIWGAKWVTVGSLVLYIVGQFIVAGGSSSLFIVIAGRGIQGFGMAIASLGMAVINQQMPPKYKSVMIALFSSMLGFGMSMGFIGGSAAMQNMKWNEVFYITAAIVCVLVVAFAITMPSMEKSVGPEVELEAQLPSGSSEDSKPEQKAGLRDIDYIGIVLLAAGVIGLLMGLTFSESRGWGSKMTLALVICGIIVLIAFFVWDTYCKKPLVPVRAIAPLSRLFPCIIAFCGGMAQFSLFQILPYMYTAPLLDYKTTNMIVVGLYLLPFGLMCLVAVAFVQKTKKYLGYPMEMLLSNVLLLICVACYIKFHNTDAQTVILNIIGGVGFGMSVISVINSVTQGCPPELYGAITGANLMLRFIGGSAGPVFASLIMAKSSITSTSGIEYKPKAFENAFIYMAAIMALTVAISFFVPNVWNGFTKEGRKQIAESLKNEKPSGH